MEIGLALGGGGARGISHIGILRALEREGIKIGVIAGTSIGGLVGAVYLSGWSPEEIQNKFSSIEQPKLYGHLKGEEPSLLGLAGGTRLLREMIGDRTFSDLKIPFAVTAVDINSCQTLEIRDGRILDAVLATIAVPGILPARRWENRLLVDGGVANPVPVDLVRKLRPELPVLAVVLSEKNTPVPNLTVPIPEFPGAAPVVDYISRLRFAQALNVFVRSIDVGGKFLADFRLELDKPDLIIRPDVGEIGLLDNIDIAQVAKLGEDAVFTNLDEIKKISGLGYRIQKIFSKR